MKPLRILHISDDRPGHYHLAEGVIAALERRADVKLQHVHIKRRRMVPGRYLRTLATADWCTPDQLMKMGYGLDVSELKPADLVVSSGGETLPVNLAAKRLLGAENIFIGSIRGIAADEFSLIVTSYENHADLPRHLVVLKPSALDPDKLRRPAQTTALGADNYPRLAGLLIGGDSGLFTYSPDEWREVFDFVRAVNHAWGTRWLVSTSPRTPPDIAQAAFELAKDKDVVADFIDFKFAGPGTLEKIYSKADLIVCSEDSSTMISESVWARLPVVGVSPAQHAFKPEERDYRQLMERNNWCRFLPIAQLSVDNFSRALGEIEPITENPLDLLADELKGRLPKLFRYLTSAP